MAPILVFDIETIPDADGLRRVLGLGPDASDEAVVELALQRRRQATGNDFLPHHLHRVIAIACVLRSADQVRAWSLGSLEDGEAELVRRFFDGIEKYTPQLVSWNGSGFDLPVLHYRSLFHGIRAPRYWEQGDDDRDFRHNNYISRFHARHCDLMDLVAGFQNRAWAQLDDIARLCGFPGKLGLDGSRVWDAWKEGRLRTVRDYCETDVANTYLVYQRFQLVRGALTPEAYEREMALFRAFLAEQPGAHWREFAAAWPA